MSIPKGLNYNEFRSEYARVNGKTSQKVISDAWKRYKDGKEEKNVRKSTPKKVQKKKSTPKRKKSSPKRKSPRKEEEYEDLNKLYYRSRTPASKQKSRSPKAYDLSFEKRASLANAPADVQKLIHSYAGPREIAVLKRVSKGVGKSVGVRNKLRELCEEPMSNKEVYDYLYDKNIDILPIGYHQGHEASIFQEEGVGKYVHVRKISFSSVHGLNYYNKLDRTDASYDVEQAYTRNKVRLDLKTQVRILKRRGSCVKEDPSFPYDVVLQEYVRVLSNKLRLLYEIDGLEFLKGNAHLPPFPTHPMLLVEGQWQFSPEFEQYKLYIDRLFSVGQFSASQAASSQILHDLHKIGDNTVYEKKITNSVIKNITDTLRELYHSLVNKTL
jgi:hypothetical protein